MALQGFRADIVAEPTRHTGLVTRTVLVDLEVWGGGAYGDAERFVFDTGAETSLLTVALARTLGLSTVGGRRVNVRGATGTGAGLLVPFRFRFARWPDAEVSTVCVVVPGERERGLPALRDVYPRFEFLTFGGGLFFIPPAAG